MRRVGPVLRQPADVLAARWGLSELSAFASYPQRRAATDTEAQRALRALMAEHRAEPLPAPSAYAQALAVLEEHDGGRAFEAWKRRHGGSAGHWTTRDARLRESRRYLGWPEA